MSVIVKDIKMPCSCTHCDSMICQDNYAYCTLTTEKVDVEVANRNSVRQESCPLIELPTPHGRLIDATAFRQKLNEMVSQNISLGTLLALLKVIEELEKMPTIVEAEMEE